MGLELCRSMWDQPLHIFIYTKKKKNNVLKIGPMIESGKLLVHNLGVELGSERLLVDDLTSRFSLVFENSVENIKEKWKEIKVEGK